MENYSVLVEAFLNGDRITILLSKTQQNKLCWEYFVWLELKKVNNPYRKKYLRGRASKTLSQVIENVPRF